jgi:hypothetical protein
MLKMVKVFQHAVATVSSFKKKRPVYWRGSESHSIYAEKRRVLVDKIRSLEASPLAASVFKNEKKTTPSDSVCSKAQ